MAALLAVAVAVPYAFLWRMGAGAPAAFGIGTLLWAAALAAAWALVRRGGNLPLSAGPVPGASVLLAAIVVVGIALRLAWVAALPPAQFSDFADYWQLAVGLNETGEYATRGGEHVLRAWRPPGYPLVLAGLMRAFGAAPWLPTASNIVFYAGTAWLAFAIGREVASPRAGLIAAALVSAWPSYVAITGFAGTEPVSILLVAAMTLLVLRVRPGGRAVAGGIAIGVVAGMAALIRPAFMVVPILVAIAAFVAHRIDRPRLAAAAVAAVAMAVTIAPWTLRNHAVLGHWVPISTNGGDILYRANNPLATGGYTKRGAIDTSALKADEVAWDRRNHELAVAWIEANPVEFLALAVRKAGIFLGTDETGVYLSLRSALGGRDLDTDDAPLAIAANLFWLVAWLALGCALALRMRAFRDTPAVAMVTLFALLLLPIHMIYESQPRYHMPMIGPLVVLVACALCALRRPAA